MWGQPMMTMKSKISSARWPNQDIQDLLKNHRQVQAQNMLNMKVLIIQEQDRPILILGLVYNMGRRRKRNISMWRKVEVMVLMLNKVVILLMIGLNNKVTMLRARKRRRGGIKVKVVVHETEKKVIVLQIVSKWYWYPLCTRDTYGVNMLILASADVYYGGHFPSHVDRQKQGLPCKLAGFLSIFSSEGSVFFIASISIDRIVSIRWWSSIDNKMGQNLCCIGSVDSLLDQCHTYRLSYW